MYCFNNRVKRPPLSALAFEGLTAGAADAFRSWGILLRANMIYFIILLVADALTSLLALWNLSYSSGFFIIPGRLCATFTIFTALIHLKLPLWYQCGMQVCRLSFDSARPARHAQLPDPTWHCTSPMKFSHSLAPGQFWLPNCD